MASIRALGDVCVYVVWYALQSDLLLKAFHIRRNLWTSKLDAWFQSRMLLFWTLAYLRHQTGLSDSIFLGYLNWIFGRIFELREHSRFKMALKRSSNPDRSTLALFFLTLRCLSNGDGMPRFLFCVHRNFWRFRIAKDAILLRAPCIIQVEFPTYLHAEELYAERFYHRTSMRILHQKLACRRWVQGILSNGESPYSTPRWLAQAVREFGKQNFHCSWTRRSDSNGKDPSEASRSELVLREV